jgi:hypothetical protein
MTAPGAKLDVNGGARIGYLRFRGLFAPSEGRFREAFCFVAKLRPFFPRRARGSCLIRRENRTKNVYVKHFCGAGNLTSAHTNLNAANFR